MSTITVPFGKAHRKHCDLEQKDYAPESRPQSWQGLLSYLSRHTPQSRNSKHTAQQDRHRIKPRNERPPCTVKHCRLLLSAPHTSFHAYPELISDRIHCVPRLPSRTATSTVCQTTRPPHDCYQRQLQTRSVYTSTTPITFPRNIFQLYALQLQHLRRLNQLELRTFAVLLRRTGASFRTISDPHVKCSSKKKQPSQTNRAHTWCGATYRWKRKRSSSNLPQT